MKALELADLAAVRGGGQPEPVPWIIHRPIFVDASRPFVDIIRIDVRPPPLPWTELPRLP